MKNALICAFLTIGTLGPLHLNCAAQTQKSYPQADHRPSPLTPIPFCGHASEKDEASTQGKGRQNNDKSIRITQMPVDPWYIASVIATIVLVGVGSFGVWKAHQTFVAIKEQAIASTIAAEAAQKQTGMIINKERARLRVEIENFKMLPDRKMEVTGLPYVEKTQVEADPVFYKMPFYAPTPAFIRDSKIGMVISNKKDISIDELGKDFGQRMVIPEIIHSGMDPNYLWPIFPDNMSFTQDQLNNLVKESTFLHAYGFIFYEDVFEEKRVTRFHFRLVMWKLIAGKRAAATGKSPEGFWIKCGPPEDNYQT